MKEQRLILLVEDNDDDVELTLRALRRNRVANRVDVVRDGAEALEYLFASGSYAGRDVRDTPNLVLLDLKLPKVGGLEVLERLRADPRTRRLPVVILTSSNVESDLARSYDLGANSYIRKPVDFTQFMEAVNQLGLYWPVSTKPLLTVSDLRSGVTERGAGGAPLSSGRRGTIDGGSEAAPVHDLRRPGSSMGAKQHPSVSAAGACSGSRVGEH
jgi:two-component system response regulator